MSAFQLGILSSKIVIDALEESAHCFVGFFIINIEQIIIKWVYDRQQSYKEVFQN